MIVTLLYISSAFLVVFALFVFGRARKLRQDVLLEKQSEEIWIQAEIERAGRQLHSGDLRQIVAACQTLYALEHPVRPAIAVRLIELSGSPNFRLAAHASAAYTRVESAGKNILKRASAA